MRCYQKPMGFDSGFIDCLTEPGIVHQAVAQRQKQNILFLNATA
jgi:hypothetical protein